jgi:hypothetical protein
MVLPTYHVSDARVEVVDGDRKVVQHRAVGARDHRVVAADI